MFLKVIIRKEAQNRIEDLNTAWMGSNLSHDGLKEVTKNISKSLKKKLSPEEEKKFVQNEWARLAGFMQGRK